MPTISTLSHWFDEGVRLQHRWLLVLVDEHTFESTPKYFDSDELFEALVRAQDPGDGERCDAVYDLTQDKLTQLRKRKCWSIGGAQERAS